MDSQRIDAGGAPSGRVTWQVGRSRMDELPWMATLGLGVVLGLGVMLCLGAVGVPGGRALPGRAGQEPVGEPKAQPQEPTTQPTEPAPGTSTPAVPTPAPNHLVVRGLTVQDAGGRARIVLSCDDAGVARLEIRDGGGTGRVTVEVASDGTAAALLGTADGRGIYGAVPVDPQLQPSFSLLDQRGKARMMLGLANNEEAPFLDLLDRDGQARINLRLDGQTRGTLEVKDDGGRVVGGILGR